MRAVFPAVIMAAMLVGGAAIAQDISTDLSAKCTALAEASRHGQILTEQDRLLLAQCRDFLVTGTAPSNDT